MMPTKFNELLFDHMHEIIGYDLEALGLNIPVANLTKQQLAFLKLCEELYLKADDYYKHQLNVPITEFNQQLHDICHQYQNIIYKDLSTQIIGCFLTVLSLGLLLLSACFRDTFFTNPIISEGIKKICDDLQTVDDSLLADPSQNQKVALEKAENSNLTHRNLIDCAKKLGYSPNNDGICHGFSMRWIEASILGEQDLFNNRLQKIYKLFDLLNAGHTLEEIEKNPVWKNHLLEIKAFYESLMLYQSPFDYEPFFEKKLKQKDLHAISQVACSEQIMQLGGLHQSKPIFYDAFDEQGITHLTQHIEKTVEETKYQDNVCLRLELNNASGYHSVCLIYAPKLKHWQFMDINDLNASRTFESCSNICKFLPFKHYETYCAQLVLPHLNKAQELLEKWAEYPTINLRINTPNYLESLFFQAICTNDEQTIQEILDQCQDPNFANAKGITPLFLSVCENKPDIVKLLLADKRINPNLSYKGATPLIMATKGNYLETVALLLADKRTDPNLGLNLTTSPLVLAEFLGHVDIANLIKTHQTQISSRPNSNDDCLESGFRSESISMH